MQLSITDSLEIRGPGISHFAAWLPFHRNTMMFLIHLYCRQQMDQGIRTICHPVTGVKGLMTA